MALASAGGAGSLRMVEAIFRNPALYELSEAIPRSDRTAGGRPSTYPSYMLLAFEAMISVYRSARRVEAELADPLVWGFIQSIVEDVFPADPSMHLPAKPMRRHHYLYGRERHLTDPETLAEIGRLHRELAADQARELGLLDPEGPGSWTHPDLSRMLHADGKVITPLYLAKPGDTHVESTPARSSPAGPTPTGGSTSKATGRPRGARSSCWWRPAPGTSGAASSWIWSGCRGETRRTPPWCASNGWRRWHRAPRAWCTTRRSGASTTRSCFENSA